MKNTGKRGRDFPCYSSPRSLLSRKSFPVISQTGICGIRPNCLLRRGFQNMARPRGRAVEFFPVFFPVILAAETDSAAGRAVRKNFRPSLRARSGGRLLEVGGWRAKGSNFPVSSLPIEARRLNMRPVRGEFGVTCGGRKFEGFRLVQLGGFEPPTSGSTIRRSNQLSYSCTLESRETRGAPAQKQDFGGVAPPPRPRDMIGAWTAGSDTD